MLNYLLSQRGQAEYVTDSGHKLDLSDQQSSSGLCDTELGWNLVELPNVTMGTQVAHVQRRAGQVCMQEASRVAVAGAHCVHNGHALSRGGACRPAARTGHAAGCAAADHCDLVTTRRISSKTVCDAVLAIASAHNWRERSRRAPGCQ